MLDLKQLCREKHRKTDPEQAQHADQPGQRQIRPEQLPAYWAEESAVNQADIVAQTVAVKFKQRIVGKAAVNEPVIVGRQSPQED